MLEKLDRALSKSFPEDNKRSRVGTNSGKRPSRRRNGSFQGFLERDRGYLENEETAPRFGMPQKYLPGFASARNVNRQEKRSSTRLWDVQTGRNNIANRAVSPPSSPPIPPEPRNVYQPSDLVSNSGHQPEGSTIVDARCTNKAEDTPSDSKVYDDIFGIPRLPSADVLSEINKEKTQYEEYMELLNDHMGYHKFRNQHKKKAIDAKHADPVIAYLKQQEPAMTVHYPQLHEAIASGSVAASSTSSECTENAREEFSKVVAKQQAAFMTHMEFDEQQHKMIEVAIGYMAGQCAKHNINGPIQLIWQKAREVGLQSKHLLHTLIHVSSNALIGKSRSQQSSATPSILDLLGGADFSEDGDDNKNNIDKEEVETSESTNDDLEDSSPIDEIAAFHDLLYEQTEQTVHSRIRLMVNRGDGMAAERMLLGSNVTLHLRVFTPVLGLLLEQGEVDSSMTVYNRMQKLDSVIFDADTYIQLLAGLAENGCFRENAAPIASAVEFGYSASGPALFDDIVGEMSEEIIEITPTSARRLYNALAKGFPTGSGLKPVGTLESLKLNNNRATNGEGVIANRVQIDRNMGICPRTGVKLSLKDLTEAQKETLKQGCRTLALERQESWMVSHSDHRKFHAVEMADEGLDNFQEKLDIREGEPYTAIVDGANVGYYMQNFDSGGFNYHQIAFVVQALEEKGETPLVILPQKYTRDFFKVGQKKQFLTRADKEILNYLINTDKLLTIGSGLLDDFYWILASVAKQTKSCAGRDLTVPVGDPNRWPGTRPVLISNDQMRDHRLGMLEPMPFKRWYSNVIVNYNFTAFFGDKCKHKEIGFAPTNFYSREIQRNLNESDAGVWHFPLAGTVDEWFCICLQNKLTSK